MQRLQIARQRGDEAGKLMRQDRDQNNRRGPDDQKKDDEQQTRRAEPRQAQPLQPVSDGIEQIAERGAGDEGREHRAEEIERPAQRQKRQAPERKLPLEAQPRPLQLPHLGVSTLGRRRRT